MKGKNILLRIDVVGQLILLILLGGAVIVGLLSFGETVIFIGVVLFFLGGWQLLSGILLGFIRGDGKRAEYVICSIFYNAFLFVGVMGFAQLGIRMPKFLSYLFLGIFFLIIPSGIAVWYLLHSQADLEKLKMETQNENHMDLEMEKILDSGEVLRNESA